jgi:dihydrofolate synthase/folylpolyglutamate synthase
MQGKGLHAWMDYIASLSAKEIDLGLQRVQLVATRMGLLDQRSQVITVGGTNGKGSTVAGLEAVYTKAGYQVGTFSSPFLLRVNEEFRLNGNEIDDDKICGAFQNIESIRKEIPLTPFEFKTLAALSLFHEARVDVMILEVGLGGRLDAVNVMDADISVITSIGIDHIEYLGNTRELIAKEKAGIFRQGAPVVCGDSDPPQSLRQCAVDLSAPFFYSGQDFRFEEQNGGWSWESGTVRLTNLPIPQLALENMASVLMVVELMQSQLPVTQAVIMNALREVHLPGRLQIFPGEITKIFDVSHNPASAAFLKKTLEAQACEGKTRAVFSMLVDKDILTTLQIMKSSIQEWYVAPLNVKRAASLLQLEEAFKSAGIEEIKTFATIAEAYQSSLQASKAKDRLVVFGSFHTVADVMRL